MMNKSVFPKLCMPAGLIVIACLLSLVFFWGCGEKAPPRPPENKVAKIAAPYDLKIIQQKDVVHLTWKQTPDKKTAALLPDVHEVFVAVKTIGDCEGCPFIFKTVGIVEMPQMQFYYKMQKGFKYYFRIRARDVNNIVSPYTKTVHLEYK